VEKPEWSSEQPIGALNWVFALHKKDEKGGVKQQWCALKAQLFPPSILQIIFCSAPVECVTHTFISFITQLWFMTNAALSARAALLKTM